jgi:signal transduction protein with GAF and PtsI domain
MVPETSVVINQLARLIAREDFINLGTSDWTQFLFSFTKVTCIYLYIFNPYILSSIFSEIIIYK